MTNGSYERALTAYEVDVRQLAKVHKLLDSLGDAEAAGQRAPRRRKSLK